MGNEIHDGSLSAVGEISLEPLEDAVQVQDLLLPPQEALLLLDSKVFARGEEPPCQVLQFCLYSLSCEGAVVQVGATDAGAHDGKVDPRIGQTGAQDGVLDFVQAALLTADEKPIVLLTRRPDLQQAKETSTISDVRIWYNSIDADPARDLRDIMEEHGL